MKSQTLKSVILVFILILVAYFLNIGCPIHHFLGIYCPGCGITRMFISMFELDFYQAFRYNPLVFIYLIGYILYMVIKLLIKTIFKKNIKIPEIVTYILIVLALLFCVLRNIDIFSWLAPTILNK